MAWLLLSTTSAHAAITTQGYWRMGENDPGAASGATVTNVADIGGAHPLVFHGAVTYSVDVLPLAANSPGSSLSVNFTNSAYATNAIVSTATDNFGIECWVKPTTSGTNQVIVYNGITGGAGSGGWGLFIANDHTYQALFGGAVTFGTNVATPNVWTHLALVRASGISTLYVNGMATVTNGVVPGIPRTNFALASAPQSPPGQTFAGLLDEVRVFTFAAGQFSTNDLLFQRPNLVVTNLADNGVGSLRTALSFARDGDVITFATNGVITLSGELAVTNSVTISGPGATKLAISGNGGGRIFNVATNTLVTISGLTIRNGNIGPGAGIYNAGNLTLNFCVISNNASELTFNGAPSIANPGGGLYNVGSVLLKSCTLCNNRAGSIAAAFSGNGPAGYDGGAVYNLGSATLVQCTVYNNSAGRGGDGGFGIPNPGGGGAGGNGGGIANAGTGSLQLIASTVAMNSGGAGGMGPNNGPNGPMGANGGILHTGSQANLINTIVSANVGNSAPDVSGAFTSLGHNLIGNPSGATGFTNGIKGDVLADAALGPFGFYGGSNQLEVLGLLPSSPALNGGDDAILSTPYLLTTDQRGLPRKSGAYVDIGAYESDINFSNAICITAPTTPFEDPIYGYWLATLQATVNPGGYPSTVYFEYGTTPSYGQQVPAGTLPFLNMSNNPVSATISNLMISQTYHYRAVATNSAGIFPGNDRTFTITPPAVVDINGDGSVDASELAAVLSLLGTYRVSLSNVNQVLLNYLSGDSLLMTNVAGLGNSNVTFNLLDSPALNFTVQSTTNLIDWQTLGPAQLIYGFTDTNAPLGSERFYRLSYP